MSLKKLTPLKVKILKRYGLGTKKTEMLFRDFAHKNVWRRNVRLRTWPPDLIAACKSDVEFLYCVARIKQINSAKRKKGIDYVAKLNARYPHVLDSALDVAVAVENVIQHKNYYQHNKTRTKNIFTLASSTIGKFYQLNYCVDVQRYVPEGIPCPYCETFFKYTYCYPCDSEKYLYMPYGKYCSLTFWIKNRLFVYTLSYASCALLYPPIRFNKEDRLDFPEIIKQRIPNRRLNDYKILMKWFITKIDTQR